jgi:hypothetical protein
MNIATKGLWLAGAVALGLALAPAGFSAPDRGERGGGEHGAAAAGPRGGGQQHFDTRYQHNHYYPARGYAIAEAPRGIAIDHGRSRYYYSGGVWYRPYGPRWVVVGPPFGVFVPFLPPFYTTVWWAGVPYYYANDTYYVWRDPARGYEVVPPPDDRQVSTAAPPSDDVFVYPKSGQSEEQTSRDRYECHRWAADQTGFDPTQPGGGAAPGQRSGDRQEYFRAMTACLEGRGYSVR